MKGKRGIRILLVMTMLAVGISLTLAAPDTAAAASKKPGKTKITSCKVQDNTVTLKWKKAKNAKSYRVFVQTGGDKWKYWKKVKKTSANKKKYSNKLKYKLKASGKKYKVYKQKHPFKVAAKKVSKKTRTYTYQGQYGTTYRFVVYAVNGKKLSKVSNIKKAVIPAQEATDPTRETDPDGSEPTRPTDSSNPTEPTNPTRPTQQDQTTYNITYKLDDGVNHPDNPTTYNLGDSIRFLDATKQGYTFMGWFRDSGFTNQIRSISPTTKGNLTLYAKFILAPVNIQGEGMDDMIWSWWYAPQVVTEGNKVFWGYANKEGYCGVACYDKSTGVTSKTELKQALKKDKKTNEMIPSVDDHNALSLTLLEDKRIMCAYAAGHDEDKTIYVRISDKPLDISSFGKPVPLQSAAVTSYGQIVKSNGRYYLFYRIGNQNWGYRTSRDGVTWTNEVLLIDTDMQYYCKFTPTTDSNKIRILMYSNPAAADPQIRMGFLDTTSEYVYGTDGKTGIGESRLDYKEFDVIQGVEKGATQRLLDVAITAPNKPRFLFTSFTSAKSANDSVYYVHDSGNTYEICKGGAPLWDPKYQLGAAFIGDEDIVVARNENATDYIEMYHFDGAKVSLKKEVFSQFVGTSSVRAARPIVDVNGKAFLWHLGYYDNSSYKSFDTSAVLYLIDEDIIIGAKKPEEPSEPDQTKYSISYVMNGGINDPSNPTEYTQGQEIELKEPTRDKYIFQGWFMDAKYSQNVKGITKQFHQDLTLYARWSLAATVEEDVDLKTTVMGWSWWTYPQVVSDGGKVFWGYISNDGYRHLAVYDEATGKTSTAMMGRKPEEGKESEAKANAISDPYCPAVTLMKDKRILCAYATDSAAKKVIHVFTSAKPLDIKSLDVEAGVTIKPAADATVKFTQIVESNGTYYLFYQLNDKGSWAYTTSKDGVHWGASVDGGEWEEGKSVIVVFQTGMQSYCKFMPTTDPSLIRILISPHPNQKKPVRMGFLNTANGMVYDADARTEMGTNKVPSENFKIVQDVEEGGSLRLLDVAVTAPKNPKFIYASFTSNDGTGSTYYLHDSAGTYKICDSDKVLVSNSQLGASFIGNQIAVARNEGGDDYIELYSYDGTAVAKESVIYNHSVSGKNHAARPIADINGKAILWHTGSYRSTKDFETYAKLYLMDSGVIVGDE